MTKKKKAKKKELNPNDFADYGDYMRAKKERGKNL